MSFSVKLIFFITSSDHKVDKDSTAALIKNFDKIKKAPYGRSFLKLIQPNIIRILSECLSLRQEIPCHTLFHRW